MLIGQGTGKINFGDVSDSSGTLTFDFPKIKAKGLRPSSNRVCYEPCVTTAFILTLAEGCALTNFFKFFVFLRIADVLDLNSFPCSSLYGINAV